MTVSTGHLDRVRNRPQRGRVLACTARGQAALQINYLKETSRIISTTSIVEAHGV